MDKLALELARSLSKNNQDEALQPDIEMNEVYIRGLLEEIKSLKKEVRKMERDYDVLYFDYQMLNPEPETRKGKCMAIE